MAPSGLAGALSRSRRGSSTAILATLLFVGAIAIVLVAAKPRRTNALLQEENQVRLSIMKSSGIGHDVLFCGCMHKKC
jgi:hypothetical protein